MFLAPINFVTSFTLVPVFSWEPVEPAEATTPPAVPLTCEGIDSTTQQQPADTSPEMRLVFKGYEWRTGVEIARYPSPSWTSGFASACTDADDRSSKRSDHNERAEELARVRKAALLATHRPDPTPTDVAHGTQEASDTD
jgi:hypothetical protein